MKTELPEAEKRKLRALAIEALTRVLESLVREPGGGCGAYIRLALEVSGLRLSDGGRQGMRGESAVYQRMMERLAARARRKGIVAAEYNVMPAVDATPAPPDAEESQGDAGESLGDGMEEGPMEMGGSTTDGGGGGDAPSDALSIPNSTPPLRPS